MSLTFKPDCASRIPLVHILLTAERVYAQLGYDCVVTSLNDSKHMQGSGHYDDRCADLRSWHLTPEHKPLIVKALQEKLGAGYFVQFEPELKNIEGKVTRAEHIHAQKNKEVST